MNLVVQEQIKHVLHALVLKDIEVLDSTVNMEQEDAMIARV
ncbi:hypothetical protein CE91St1_51130 [Parabacteroides goldsteinii]|nr:hypothetical protein CE91St1_51130 [Parabacteroides goldsteinii]GKG80622.1 hypothetical protein CE91St2_38140 [Parabacteroides goldsteinii]